MKHRLLSRAAEFLAAQRRRKRWVKVVSAMAAVVVFCTTYALILPAITMETETICGQEAHTHSDACYTVETITPQPTMLCSLKTLQENGLHKHERSCYDEEGNLVCGFADFVVHEHDESCYDLDGNLICTLEEIEEHRHSASCYREEKVLTCGQTESAGHQHGEDCYILVRGDLTCGEDHEHSDDCYQWDRVLTCTQEESEGHRHTADCYETQQILVCDKPEVELHEHDEDCYEENPDDPDGEPILVCDKTVVLEHQHGDGCVQPPEGEPYERKTLTCEKQEHEHVEACYLEEVPADEATLEEENGADDTEPAEPTEETDEEEIFTLSAQTESGIEVTVSGPAEVLPYAAEDLTLTAEEVTSDAAEMLRDQALEEAGLTAQQSFLFDVSLWHEEMLVEPTGPVTLTFGGLPMTEAEGFRVYHIDEEGEQATDMNAVLDEEDNVVLDTDHFSTYSVSLLTAATGSYTMTATHTTTETMYADSDASEYLLLAHEGGQYYALGGDGQTYPIGNNAVQYSGTTDQIKNLCWTLTEKEQGSSDAAHRRMYIRNAKTGSYLYPNGDSLLTGAKTKVNLWFQNNSDYAATIYPDDPHWPKIAFGGSLTFHTYNNGDSEGEAWFYFAKVDSLPYCRVWLDGTDGGIMSLGGAGNTCQEVETNTTFTLPTAFTPPDKYSYQLKGWYDVKAAKYYQPGATVTITQDTVFYADWGPTTYNIGQSNADTAPSLNTNAFITTHVFDYGALFNVQSSNAETGINNTEHTETWSLASSSAYTGFSLGVVFRDWDTYNKSISYPVGSETWTEGAKQANPNDNNPDIYSGLYNSGLIDILFNPSRNIIGKTYVGTGNYLYQYDDTTGYYYYDSKLNAASYNQSHSRFYIYNYLERTSDSPKDSATAEKGRDSDFLPFNSPYVNTNGKTVTTYMAGNNMSGYQYDAKYDSNEGGITCSPSNAGTNYWFGMSSSIRFYLPNDSASDGSGTLNQSTKGTDMQFKFSGDDDVWVLVDGNLVLDIGGLHGIEEGTINFSTGEVWRSLGGGETTTKSFTAGEHTLTIYYLERGGSQSNCAIYFNIAPQDYSLELTKNDRDDSNKVLPGAEFTIYTDKECSTVAANLKDANGNPVSNGTFVSDEAGQIHCYGLQPNSTYYVKETKAPPGYNGNENVIIKLSIAGIENSYRITSELYVDGKIVDINGASNIYLEEDKSAVGDERAMKYTFSNKTGYVLPETGGPGTGWHTLGGLLLLAGAGYLFYRKNRDGRGAL